MRVRDRRVPFWCNGHPDAPRPPLRDRRGCTSTGRRGSRVAVAATPARKLRHVSIDATRARRRSIQVARAPTGWPGWSPRSRVADRCHRRAAATVRAGFARAASSPMPPPASRNADPRWAKARSVPGKSPPRFGRGGVKRRARNAGVGVRKNWMRIGSPDSCPALWAKTRAARCAPSPEARGEKLPCGGLVGHKPAFGVPRNGVRRGTTSPECTHECNQRNAETP